MAALHHFLPTRKMHPTISHEFKTPLSPSLPSFSSLPLVPTRRLECQSTTGLNIIKCFHQQKYKWSKGSGGIPPTPTPSQLTNFQAYLLIPNQSVKQMVQAQETGKDYSGFNLNLDKKRKRGGDPNDGRPDNKRPKHEVQSEAGTITTTTTGDHHHHHLGNSVNIGLEIMGDGEYVVEIKRRSSSTGGSSSTHEEEVERAKQMAQKAAMLILHGELLQDMGKKLLAQTQASLRSIYGIGMPPAPAPPSDPQSDH